MNYSSIGNFNFIKMSGPDLPSLASYIEIIDRPGVDSTGHRDNALKAESIQKYTTEGLSQLSTANGRADF